jgi:hypothetical protein
MAKHQCTGTALYVQPLLYNHSVPLALCAFALCFLLQKTEAAKPVIDNERVAVFDVTLAKGQAIPARPRGFDVVKVYLAGGTIRTTQPDGKSIVVTRSAGDAVFEPKGMAVGEELVSGDPAREIVIELKDHKVEPMQNTSGYPNAFPRPGSKRLIENDRVAVWDYSWRLGLPTAMHFHDKDVVVIYLENGILRSITPDGESVDNNYPAGSIRFNLRKRAHYEQLTSGAQRAIITELK